MFDKCKEAFDKNVFGRGFIFRIISKEEIAAVSKLSRQERENGIYDSKRIYVPYDKGDRDGNRWYLETPYYINWSKESVLKLQTSSRSRWQGYDYYFKEGFCWSDVHTVYLKSRLKSESVYDVKSMSLFSMVDEEILSEKYIVALINSKMMAEFQMEFLNNTSSFQINDARKIPIIIPNKNQLEYVNKIVDDAVAIKRLQFSGKISDAEAEEKLNRIQYNVDKFVYDLYDIEVD